MPDSVQPPDGGQGDSGSTPGVFDSYLETVPEDARETVGSYLKDAEKTVNGRLEEAGKLKENWGAYETHLADYRDKYKPEDLAQILAWHQQVSADDNAYQQWLKDQATQAGLLQADEPLPDEGGGELTREEIQRLIDEQAQERLAPLQERLEAWETERLTDQEEQGIRSELERLESEHGLKLSKEQQAMVLDLGMSHQGDGSWVQSGFERFQEITTQGQQLFVARAQNQPGQPLTTGAPAAVKPPTTFEDAAKMARERFRAQQ